MVVVGSQTVSAGVARGGVVMIGRLYLPGTCDKRVTGDSCSLFSLPSCFVYSSAVLEWSFLPLHPPGWFLRSLSLTFLPVP